MGSYGLIAHWKAKYNTALSNIHQSGRWIDIYFFLKNPCRVLCPPGPFFIAPLAVLLILGFRSLSTDVVEAVREGAGAVAFLGGAAAFGLEFKVSGSDSPEYDSSVS